MAMAEAVRIVRALSLYRWISTPKGAKGSLSLYTVPLNRELLVDRLEIYFPVGCESQVEAKITLDGIQQFPYGDVYRGDDATFVTIAGKIFPPGSNLIVEWENKDTVNDLAFSVHLSCTEREKLLDSI